MKRKPFWYFWLISLVFLSAGVSLTACIPSPADKPTAQKATQPANSSPSTNTPLPIPTPLPKEAATATLFHLGCPEQSGHVERGQVDTNLLSKPLAYRLYLPPCFRSTSSQAYPLLVLLHGQGFKDDQWERLGVAQVADELIISGDVDPFLIVMPYEEDSLINIQDSSFDQVVVDVLMPCIEKHYPICPERDCRAIGGISRGAIWAVRIGFLRWEEFGTVGAHSYPIPGDSASFLNWLRKIPENQLPNLYLDIGTNDYYLSSAVKFAAMLNEYRVPHEWHLNPGSHTEKYWQAHVREYLNWYGKQIAAP